MLKFGMVGAGMIAQSGYDGLQASGSAEVIAIADTSPVRLRAFASRNKIGRTFPTVEELLRNKDLDGIYIAVPNVFHAPYAIAALESGKHVILDKPFATSSAEAERVVEAAGRAKKLFMLGHEPALHGRRTARARPRTARLFRGDLSHAGLLAAAVRNPQAGNVVREQKSSPAAAAFLT